MKNYPRLYSISTVGIRQHQEFDYSFHGFRTDFVGDSGCGKSMIADLIQLVFVGSEVFESGTESMEKREVDGMVLRTIGGKGTDMGYVLLNIELAKGQYVVIGAYLESSSRRSRSFIIQKGYDEMKLQALERPLTISDVIYDGLIPTVELFKLRLEENEFVFQEFPQRKKFHSYLFKHELLSIDLSQSDQILKDYSAIIQSFSRGKNLNIRDSTSLKRFLFGNEKAKEITQKYKSAVEELKMTLKEHAQNAEEIKIVTQKHEGIKAIRELKERMENAQEEFFIRQCAYTQQQMMMARSALSDSLKDYMEAKIILQAVTAIISAELDSSEKNIAILAAQEEEAKRSYNKAFNQHGRLLPFLSLRDTYSFTSSVDLLNIYTVYHRHKQDYQVISGVDAALKTNGVSDLFLDYVHLSKLGQVLEAISEDLQIKEKNKKEKEQLLAFAEFNTEGSLGYWAIQNYQAYSLEVESLLMHFRDFPVFSPQKDNGQYIINPSQLLKEKDSIHKDADGFWVTFGELSQYIPYTKNRLFTSSDVESVKSLLATLSNDLTTEVEQLAQEIARLKLLKECVSSLSTLEQYLAIADRESKISSFKENPDLEISEKEIEEGCILLQAADQIKIHYDNAEKDWKSKQRSLDSYNTTVSAIKISLHEVELILESASSASTFKKAEAIFPELTFKHQDNEQHIEYLQTQYEKAESREGWVDRMISDNRAKLSTEQLKKLFQDHEQNLESSEKAFKEARLALCREPDISIYTHQHVKEPNEERNNYNVSKTLYANRFSELVKQHAAGESYRFETTQNYLELCTTLLPDAFLDETIENDNSVEIISEYLSKINDKNKNLNNRKLHKIRDILDEVGDEISKREDTVRQIHTFLDNGDREITGGHRVSLRANSFKSYPKEWINNYIEKLSSENTLFATGTILSELLSDSVSLDEKMINAFHTFGGHRGLKPKVEDLLNPNSYFDLTFNMESQASGKTNIGSTGQVYAAIALLCIARLSLVDKGSFNKHTPTGIRFMPIDEAEGLGSNFDLLYDIARDFDYQIITMSIKPLGKFKEGEQYIYMLSNNKEFPEDVNYQPFAVFCDSDQQF